MIFECGMNLILIDLKNTPTKASYFFQIKMFAIFNKNQASMFFSGD